MKKIKGWYFIPSAIIIFIADLLTLGNRNIFPAENFRAVATIFVFLAALMFVFGVVKTIIDVVSGTVKEFQKTAEVKKEEAQEGQRTTRTERTLRIILGLTLILSVIPWVALASFMGLIVGFPYIILGLYLLFYKRYHLIFDIFLFLIGIFTYFVQFNGSSFFALYKTTTLSSCPGLSNGNTQLLMTTIGGAGKFLFFVTTLYLVTTGIFAKIRSINSRGLWSGLTLIAIIIIFLLLPFTYQPRVKLGEASSGGTGGDGQSHFATTNMSSNMAYDSQTKQYVFTAQLKNGDSSSATIQNICVDGKVLSSLEGNYDISVENGFLNNNTIVIPSGKAGVVKIKSVNPFYSITLFEDNFHYNTNFLK